MKKIFLLFAAVGVFIACDPVHEKIDNGGHITEEELVKMSSVIVDKAQQIADQKTYTAVAGTPITLIDNIDVKDCDGVTIYFDPESVADTCWRISISGGEPEKILKKSQYFRYNVPDGATNVSTIALTHIKNTETNNITIKAIYKTFGYKVADSKGEIEHGNVITCYTSAPVNAKWSFSGKEKIGNFASNKMKVNWDEDGNLIPTDHVITLTALCPDGTVLVHEYPIRCDKISNPLVKYYIYGDPNRDPSEEPQPPFQPGAWDAAAMRFSSTEGAHLPTISDDVYFGLKTLLFDVSDVTPDFDLKVMNGWWSNTYYDHVKWVDGVNELQITQTMADECAKGGEGRDLDLMLYSGSMTLNSVYYEE